MALPTVSEIGVSAVTETGASVEFTIDPGELEILECGFRYGLPGDELTEVVVEYDSPGLLTGILSPLKSNTTYYFVGFATNEEGTASTDMISFTTNSYDMQMSSQVSDYKSKVTQFSVDVPFYRMCTICQAEIGEGIVIEPLNSTAVGKVPIPGATALYRLRGDGVNSPTFSHAFKKTTISEEYDSTLGAVNLVSFLYDGIDFWYTIYLVDNGPM